MTKRKHLGLLILLGLLTLICASLYVTLVHMRTQSFVHKYLTPPYESEATDFFYANLDELNHLVSQMQECGNQEFYFVFHDHRIDAPNIPEKILESLRTLEKSTQKGYAVTMTHEAIEIAITSETNFDIFLYYGIPLSTDERDKTSYLDSDWELHAPYIIRG